MSERKHVPRLTDFDQPSGWYFEDEGCGKPFVENPDGSMVVFKCPNCHMHGSLRLHNVDANGEVNASVGCNGKKKVQQAPNEWARVPCDYHEYVILDEWPTNCAKLAGELVRVVS
jgi:hypothetical protein